jgi:hypothetical protein
MEGYYLKLKSKRFSIEELYVPHNFIIERRNGKYAIILNPDKLVRRAMSLPGGVFVERGRRVNDVEVQIQDGYLKSLRDLCFANKMEDARDLVISLFDITRKNLEERTK